jgi:peroxiredoxin
MKKFAFISAAILMLCSFKLTGYEVGDKAMDFKLKNIDGKMVSMSDYKDAKGFIVIFTCNHCPFAKAYEDRINALNAKYASLGYPVIAINPNDPTQVDEDSYVNMQQRAKDKKFTFTYLVDETQAVAKAYGAAHTPHVYVLEKYGNNYMVRYIGAIDDNSDDPSAVKEKYVENAVNNLLAGKPVNPSSTKAIGCGIKWKNS